ncbi:PASTA domain-containing protein [Amycolatopsis pigmentata]|uniref:PASTA domain-containing protein n=1 Tax=Amycolatopsis pigmentata TaxID=450801 RepID=A0ABW5FQU6_9PSEU
MRVFASVIAIGLFALLAACVPPHGGEKTPGPAASSPAKLITVPDVSGMNHQDAQNAMQRAGLYNLREVDGKGLGRALINDRNWVQVGQDPPAGTQVPPGTVITLTAIKYTDR